MTSTRWAVSITSAKIEAMLVRVPLCSASLSAAPNDVQMDRQRMLGFACLPKTQSCVVELKNVRLVSDRIRVNKPYLTRPIGWPVAGRTPYQIKNLSDKAVKVTAKIS